MADTITTQIIQDGPRVVVVKLLNISDGTGESLVRKVDVSNLEKRIRDNRPCSRVQILRAWHNISGMAVDLFWENLVSNTHAWTLSGDGYMDFRSAGPVAENPVDEASTGDILLSTIGHDSGDRYAIMLELEKLYEATAAVPGP